MDPVLLTISGYEIRWYSILLVFAVIVGILLFQREGKKFKVKPEFVFNMAFWAIIFGLIGARLYYVIFNWDYFGDNLNEIYQIWEGGLAIHGGIIAGFLTVLVYCKKYKVRVIRYLDFIAVPLLLAQAIGRWGNFFNSEAHGVATTVEHLRKLLVPEFVIDGMNIEGVYYTPTFFYESVACLILFIIFIIIRRGKYIKVGTLTGLYLIGYGVIRFFIEISRTDALLLSGFKIAQIVSIIMIIIGLIIIIINSKKSKFEDLYNDKNNIDSVNFY
ncbi:MAG: prolipoprotein diacylglyceryl transferase [Bacilli bacterium]|nr:prolipoprotein diacylglyceryl transferase [Bacilli bacterium]